MSDQSVQHDRPEEIHGPVMLCATQILKRPPLRISHVAGNVNLPRPVRALVLFAAVGGALVGFGLGLAIGGFRGGIYGGLFLGTIGGLVVTYSPLKGESFFAWAGLAVRTRRREVSIDGTPVRLAVGVTYVDNPRRGSWRVQPGSVQVIPEQWDERGVLRSSENFNLAHAIEDPTPPARARRLRGGTDTWGGSGWDAGGIHADREHVVLANVMAARENAIRDLRFDGHPPLLVTDEDRVATKRVLASQLGLAATQLLLGDAGLPAVLVPLPPYPDGRPQLVQADTVEHTVALAMDAIQYASGVTAVWVARRAYESESAWARRLFHFKVEIGAINPATGEEVNWLKVAGIDTDTAYGLEEVHKAIEGKPSKLDSIKVELSASSLANIDMGIRLLNLRDDLRREQLRQEAEQVRNATLESIEIGTIEAGAGFGTCARKLRDQVTAITRVLSTSRDATRLQRLRTALSRTADELEQWRVQLEVLSLRMVASWGVVDAVESDEGAAVAEIERRSEEDLARRQAQMRSEASELQSVLAPFYRDFSDEAALQDAVDRFGELLRVQQAATAAKLADARAVRQQVQDKLDRQLHTQSASGARVKPGRKVRRAVDLFADYPREPFPA